jgi:mannosyltransferase OCH1-like enzyme
MPMVWPLSRMIHSTDTELLLMTKHRFSNYFIASAPNNSHLQKTLDIIVDNIEQKNIGGGVYDLTGPTALNKAIENEFMRIIDITNIPAFKEVLPMSFFNIWTSHAANGLMQKKRIY